MRACVEAIYDRDVNFARGSILLETRGLSGITSMDPGKTRFPNCRSDSDWTFNYYLNDSFSNLD